MQTRVNGIPLRSRYIFANKDNLITLCNIVRAVHPARKNVNNGCQVSPDTSVGLLKGDDNNSKHVS